MSTYELQQEHFDKLQAALKGKADREEFDRLKAQEVKICSRLDDIEDALDIEHAGRWYVEDLLYERERLATRLVMLYSWARHIERGGTIPFKTFQEIKEREL